jgi:hypothetical protein
VNPHDKGPTFPTITKTAEWHMAAHETPMPEVTALVGARHPLEMLNVRGAQHNPTVYVRDGNLHIVIRALSGTKTTNYTAQMDTSVKTWRIMSPRTIIVDEQTLAISEWPERVTGQLEDLRMFMWRRQPWAIAATHTNSVAIRQALLEMNPTGTHVLKIHAQPSSRHEKNWMPIVDGDDLGLVYSIDPLVVLGVGHIQEKRPHPPQVHHANFSTEPEYVAMPSASTVAKGIGHVRGGSQLVPWHNGKWLAIVHQVYKLPLMPQNHNHLLSSFWPPPIKDPVAGVSKVVYLHRFAEFAADLKSVTLGDPFYFNEVGIEFCAGLAEYKGQYVAAYGVADKEAWLVAVTKETIVKTLEPGYERALKEKQVAVPRRRRMHEP